MRISMIPSNDVKTIHASQNDTQREWSFEPFDNNGTLIIGEESLASIKRIKGNTLVFNQLLQNGNFASTNKWFTQEGATQSVSNNVMTVTSSADRGFTVNVFNSIPTGHKCLVSGECKTASPNARAILVYCGSYSVSSAQISLRTSSTNWERLTGIVTSAGNEVFQFRLYADSATNQFRNVMLIDLTQMFGAGKEPTVEQFKALFPLPYYSYQSTLLPFKGTSIKTVGKNQLQFSGTRTDYGVTFTDNGDGTITVNGTASGRDAEYRIAINANTLIEGNYYFQGAPNQPNDQTSNVYIWDSSTSTRAKRWDKTTNVNTLYTDTQREQLYIDPTHSYTFCIRVMNGKTANNLVYKPMVVFSDADSTFEPYTSSITDLPTLTYFPNGMKSAGNVYDELLPNKAITRVGAYTITSFQAKSGATANNLFSINAIVDLVKRPSADTVLANFSSNFGEAVTMMQLWSNDKVGVAINNFGVIYVGFGLNGSVTTLEQANAYVQSNPITVYYELKTPTETDINTEVFYPVYQYGTEQILPINGANPTTSPFVGDIYYADGLKTDQTFLYRQTPINYNTRQFALVSKNTETPLTLKDGKGYCNSPLALTNESGFFDAKLKMTDSDGVCYSEKFQIHVERRP